MGWINRVAFDLFSGGACQALNAKAENPVRPLMVAFMGGTGVGKSALLNRLAGQAIARTGVERPTSHEVTLFYHRHVGLNHLPDDLPMAATRIAQHEDEAKKNIIWIDMPDIDSVEAKNKTLVLAWLPHIDILIYVVSPERYRDDKEWRLLISEGGRHAWVFVFNQWDKGCFEQYQDFQLQLKQAGFIDPVIFTTACVFPRESDQFDDLQALLISLATEHTLKFIEQRNLQLKMDELAEKLQFCLKLLGSASDFEQAIGLWQAQWQRTKQVLLQGFAWPIKQIALYSAEHAADLLTQANGCPYLLWNDWAQTRFDDALNEYAASADQLALPVAPLKQRFASLIQKVGKIIQANNEMAIRQSLANPGNHLQRFFLKFVRFCEISLPLICICWVAYQVFTGYYYSSTSANPHYLGSDFAIHSVLLIVIAWLLPFFILKQFRPSLEKSVLRGLNKALLQSMIEIESAALAMIKEINDQHQEQIAQASQIIRQCRAIGSAQTSQIPRERALERMLIKGGDVMEAGRQ